MRLMLIILLTGFFFRPNCQLIPEFSTLSSQPLSSSVEIHSLQISDGILYYIKKPDGSRTLYKVNYGGNLVDSTEFTSDGFEYTGQLYTRNGRYFLVGNAFKPFVSWSQAFEESRRSIVEFDENLNVIDIHLYDLLPDAAGNVVSTQLGVGSGFALFQPQDAQHLKGDTMMMTRDYIFFDTLTLRPLGHNPRLEKVVLNDSFYSVKSLGQNIEGYKGAAIIDDSIYIYAAASECCPDVLIDFTNLGVFNSNGDFARKVALLPQPNGLIDVAYDANGLLMNGKIFTSYTDVIDLYSPSCEAAVIDIRDINFNFLRLAKIPLCGFYPSGTKSFAELENTIYFQTRNTDGDIGLCKYDTLLNLQWSRIFDFEESHVGISINTTPDGGCIMECTTGANPDILKLYKVDAIGDIASSTSLSIAPITSVKVFPNPFTEWIGLEGVAESDAPIEIYDAQGRLRQFEQYKEQNININSSLIPGSYLLIVRSNRSKQVLHSQKIAKN